MKKYIYTLVAVVLFFSCGQNNQYEIPTDENGNIIWTGVSSTTTTGISSIDNSFTVTATFATAKVGDVMKVELLQLQTPPDGGTTKQLLPLANTQKEVTVGNDMKASVSYTRDQANLNEVGDYVVVVFNGATDYAKQRVDMVNAMTVSKPTASGKEIEVARTAEVAYFNVRVTPKEGTFTGNVAVRRKNGTDGTWIDVAGSPYSGDDQPYLVPIAGTDFIAENDTMFYTFTATQGSYQEVIESTVIVRDPYFYLKKSATLALGTSSAGRDLLVNGTVPANDPMAMIAVEGSLILKGGSTYLSSGKTIQFVPSTTALYALNNSNTAIAEFESGTPSDTLDPISGQGVYIFKAVTGPNPADVYYGMIMVTGVIPNQSVSFEYRIGNQYAHLSVVR
ncbi:MAG: hypothetical protein ACOX14_08150 [Fermentimonas caenicola]|jgi:hypothetical protein|uniref:Uncharacterized protein n=3 Tax=Petrimonas mucosa TaxID=1642646 RepID=A0A1G4G5X1_9BACT|nr:MULTISPECIES: hypothetical protein [Petrimonas]MDD3560247.1 hypothetical protein [Petrimonas mucosa]SCM56895.1 putative protein {ECO:0000313/EMBL:GAI79458,1} [Petrimonas mucosa]SFU38620.1 hypothetical protein SAMN05216364_100766 [Porphyromonadaceae bacterium KHP3R9]HHT29686.1 hypothetical protein [Petrimonas mucosa]